MLTNYHILEVTFISPTNHRGARLKIKSLRFDQSIIIPFDDKLTGIDRMAAEFLKNRGFNLVGMGESKKGFLIISDTFGGIK